MAFLNIPALLIIVGGTSGAVDGLDQLPDVHGACPSSTIMTLQGLGHRRPAAHPGRWSASPRRRAATACSRSRRTSPRSTTPTRRRACSWSSTAPTPTSSRTILESEIDGMAQRHAPDRRHVHDGRRLRPDARHPRHRHGPRPRAREPVDAGRRSAPRSPARSSRRSTASSQRQPALPARSATSSRRCRPTEINHRYDDARGASSRSRPATTRACSPRSSRPTCRRPSAAPPRRARAAVGRGAGCGSGRRHERPRLTQRPPRRRTAAAGTRAATSAGSSPTPT